MHIMYIQCASLSHSANPIYKLRTAESTVQIYYDQIQVSQALSPFDLLNHLIRKGTFEFIKIKFLFNLLILI